LGRKFPGTGTEEQISLGLDEQSRDLLERRVDRLLIDRGYKAAVVEAVCRRSGSSVAMPARGEGLSPANKPFSEYRRQPGQTIGHHWRIPSTRGTRELRYVQIDTNYWKSFVRSRLLIAVGAPGALSLFGTAKQATGHALFAEHLIAEGFVKMEARGRVIEMWRCPPGHDNHWWDCLVGCTAAASMEGVLAPGAASAGSNRRSRVKLSALQGAR